MNAMGNALHRFRAVHVPKLPVRGRHFYHKKNRHGSNKLQNTDLDELDLSVARYTPSPISLLMKQTNFTKQELKTMYRGFKQECPSGIVTEETFKQIYAQFFPKGSNTALYAHYVFSSFDSDKSGSITFEQFVNGLSIIARGSHHDKLQWIFHLYDTNHDGVISKCEMIDIVHAIYELMGRQSEPMSDFVTPQAHAEELFQKMDLNRDGVISIDEFMESCSNDNRIFNELSYFNTYM